MTKSSMDEYIDKTVKRYSSLFKLPSRRTLLIELLTTCLLCGVLIATTFKFSPLYWSTLGLVLGTTLFVLTIASDTLIRFSSMNTDPVFNLRRCSALSLYSLLIWVGFILVGVVISRLLYTDVWFRFFILGFCVASALRLLVLSGVSFSSTGKIAVFAFLQPVLYIVTVVYTASTVNVLSLGMSSLAFFLFSVAVTVTAVFVYVFSIDSVGVGVLGVGSFTVLKAFMAVWAENQNAPFERLFESFSQERNIQLAVLSFRSAKGITKANMIVPTVHPGPFKRIGSSALPYAIQSAVENKQNGCVVMVPHGLSGHDLDLAAQSQNELVLEHVLRLSDISDFGKGASQFLRVKQNGASVGCQVFNSCALVSLTLAPETMEDLPPELNALIVEAARKNGFSTAIAVDAHNSIEGPFKIDEAIKPLKEAALISLEEASKLRTANLEVGVARIVPTEFSLQEGMGPGGIAALVVRVGHQTTAYITIDGNNMITGLREKILKALSEVGVDEGEVFTTDTHEVNAVVLNARGYHPVGEAMDPERLINYVKQATRDALANLEPSEVAWGTETVSGVKVIGEKQIEALSILLDKSVKRAKKLAISVFPVAGAILAALFLLI